MDLTLTVNIMLGVRIEPPTSGAKGERSTYPFAFYNIDMLLLTFIPMLHGLHVFFLNLFCFDLADWRCFQHNFVVIVQYTTVQH